MRIMRRLLVPLAVVAAALLAPSAAFAVTPPVISAALSPTNLRPSLSWPDVPDATAGFHVFRAGKNCAVADPLTDFAPVVDGELLAGTVTFTDNAGQLADGSYCYFVRSDDVASTADSNTVTVTYDTHAPVITVTRAGGDGCTGPFTFSASATDNLQPAAAVTLTVDGSAYAAGTTITPVGDPFAVASSSVVATDGLTQSVPVTVSGQIYDPTRPPAPDLTVTTDPAQQQATLSWDNLPVDGAPVVPSGYRLRTKGPQGLATSNFAGGPVVVQNLQVDATYEFTLDATDACGFGPASVRLVRLNDTTPPSAPIVAGPAFDSATHIIRLSWVASTDNIQVDHYEIWRNGVPIGATDATTFTDALPGQHSALSYVVRAVDTNGNDTDSAPALFTTPDWTPPTAPVLTVSAEGATVTLRWPAAADNVGVVGYDVLRDDKPTPIASMTSAVRTYKDVGVSAGVHTWRVRARDDAGLSAVSAPQTLKITKPVFSASLVAMHLTGKEGRGTARYTLAGPARLLIDLRIVGTLPRAQLRVYVQSGRGRITVWRGTPGSSAPRLRLGSALARHGFVTIRLNSTLHAGRVRLVLVASGRVEIAGTGAHKPKMRAG
jgi:hypothetical protein